MVLTAEVAGVAEIRPGRHVFVRRVAVGQSSSTTNAGSLQLIFCHGTCASQAQFSPFLSSLDDNLPPDIRVSCILWDQVGCAQSFPPVRDYKNGYTNQQTRTDLQAVIQKYANPDTPTVIVTHSYATTIFLPLLCQEQPKLLPKFMGALLVGTAIRSPELPLQVSGHPIMKLPVFVLNCLKRPLTEAFLQMAIHPDHGRIITAARADSNSNDMAVAKGYHCNHDWAGTECLMCLNDKKVLIVHGASDGILPVECAQFLHNSIKDSELVVVDRASHLVMMERPDFVAESVVPFLVHLLER